MSVSDKGPVDGKGGKVKETQGNYLIEPRYEIIGGIRYDFLSSPKFNHQYTLGNLHFSFASACAQDGIVLIAPMDVILDDQNTLQPDLLYIRKENKGIIREGYVYGAPDLVVEILSDSTARNDKTIKKTTYERFGVGEYWLVDPVYRLVDQFVLLEGEYRLLGTWTEDDRLASATVRCLNVSLADVFREIE